MFVLKPLLKKFLIFSGVIFLIILIIIVCAALKSGIGSDSADKNDFDKIAAGEVSSVSAETAEICKAFLAERGIEADFDKAESEKIIIPDDFNSIYEKYNDLQTQNGFDLRPYKGKRAEKVTVELAGGKPRFAVLLVVKDKVIGAHLTNGEYGDENLSLSDYGKTG